MNGGGGERKEKAREEKEGVIERKREGSEKEGIRIGRKNGSTELTKKRERHAT